MVKEYKARKASARAERPMPIEKAEFEPDNSRIGRASAGVQHGNAPKAMSADWIHAVYTGRILSFYTDHWNHAKPVVTVTLQHETTVQPLSRFIGPMPDAILTRPMNPVSDEVREREVLTARYQLSAPESAIGNLSDALCI
jgi:hypothetical protein